MKSQADNSLLYISFLPQTQNIIRTPKANMPSRIYAITHDFPCFPTFSRKFSETHLYSRMLEGQGSSESLCDVASSSWSRVVITMA